MFFSLLHLPHLPTCPLSFCSAMKQAKFFLILFFSLPPRNCNQSNCSQTRKPKPQSALTRRPGTNQAARIRTARQHHCCCGRACCTRQQH